MAEENIPLTQLFLYSITFLEGVCK